MSEEGSTNRVLSQVAPSRRGFVKSVLAGAAFAAPAIASFSIENMEIRSADGQSLTSSLTTGSGSMAYGSSSMVRCLPDLGYVGPAFFQAYVLDISGSTRVNGELSFNIEQDGKALGVRMRMTRDASVSAVSLTVNSVEVATVQMSGGDRDGFGRHDNGSEGRITAADVVGLCDFDSLLQAMASQTAKAVVQGTYASSAFDAQGSILPMSGGPVFHTENRE
ncbi:MAG: hypothetical protein ACLGPM_08390 [Acidobacteriota bacterium]